MAQKYGRGRYLSNRADLRLTIGYQCCISSGINGVIDMQTAQQLIDELNARCSNCRASRRRGDAKSIAQYKTMITETLDKLEALGYDKLDCLTWVGE